MLYDMILLIDKDFSVRQIGRSGWNKFIIIIIIIIFLI